MVRRKFSREFREEAVKLVESEGVKVSEAARDLGISESTLHNWVRKSREALLDPSSAKSEELAELKRLRKEVRRLEMERDILKKATAFFAKLEH